jgi:hypothetical protein
MWLCMMVLMHAMGGIGEEVKLKAGGGDGDVLPSNCTADAAASVARA